MAQSLQNGLTDNGNRMLSTSIPVQQQNLSLKSSADVADIGTQLLS